MPRGKDEVNKEKRRPQRPRVGAVYEWYPQGLDKSNSKLTIPEGSLVRVAKKTQFGTMRLPPPFTYVENANNGEYLGVVLEQSLRSRNQNKKPL